ncbi:hypothetical protein SO694_0005728 [Aureococcus anophagefferens]|uniref:Cyclin N-terminal domain-containing protein n=2 Tax=Aureococcus anophagefferens TaxID=44056 RepID=A0ABR1FX97_AURAN
MDLGFMDPVLVDLPQRDQQPKIVAAGRNSTSMQPKIMLPGEPARPPRPPERAGSPGAAFALQMVAPQPIAGSRDSLASRDSLDSDGGGGRAPDEGTPLSPAALAPVVAERARGGRLRVAYASPSRRMRGRQYEQVGSASGSVSRPDFDDCLRRSAAVLHKHVSVCEWRHARAVRSRPDTLETGQFRDSAAKLFEESRYVSPQYEITLFHGAPVTWTGLQFHTRAVEQTFAAPTMKDIYTFLSTLFVRAHLSSECSIVCLIYVERLMEKANVPLLAATWRPILLCSMLLASKVWQDCASWNIEFSVVFPQFSLAAINALERNYVTAVGWDMYISQSLYAKYYFALRSLNEKHDFRRKYNRFVLNDSKEQPKDANMVELRSNKIRSEWVKALSKSL